MEEVGPWDTPESNRFISTAVTKVCPARRRGRVAPRPAFRAVQRGFPLCCRKMLKLCGETEDKLAQELIHFELQVERDVIEPLFLLAEVRRGCARPERGGQDRGRALQPFPCTPVSVPHLLCDAAFMG